MVAPCILGVLLKSRCFSPSCNQQLECRERVLDRGRDEEEELFCQYRGADRAAAFILFLLDVVSQQWHGQISCLAY